MGPPAVGGYALKMGGPLDVVDKFSSVERVPIFPKAEHVG